MGGLLFWNRTELIFEPRLFSTFIQFSKPIYAMGDLIKFRVIPYEVNLMLKNRVYTTIELVDSNGVAVRRWLSPRNNARGYIELSFQLPPTCSHGEWKVRCSRETFVTEKSFIVFYNTNSGPLSVNVSLPQKLSEFAFGIFGILEANHTTNAPTSGNATLRLQLRSRGAQANSPPLGTLWKYIPYFKGRASFLFTMSEIKKELKLSTQLRDLDVRVDATVVDWYYLLNISHTAHTVVFRETPDIKFLGGRVRQFKPGFPFTAVMRVFQPDGREPNLPTWRVSMSVYCDTGRLIQSDQCVPIPDDSVVRYTVQTSSNCINYRLVAVLQSAGNSLAKTAEQFIFRHYSATGAYLRVTTSTVRPTVDRYMVFNVRSTHYTPQIHYLVEAGGNIVFSDIVSLPRGLLSKTFSIALSREMAPVARLVAYFMKQDGELVTDALSFFVGLRTGSSVQVRLTEGSDLSGNSLAGWVRGSPGSFVLLSALPYELYSRFGIKVIMETNLLIDELRSYESHAEQPLSYRWFEDDRSDQASASYYPAATVGPDANKTMNFSGLLMFTDANYSAVTFWHTCNETQNPDRAFPCYSTADRCYGHRQRCDGNIDCETGVDELNCDSAAVENSLAPGSVTPRLEPIIRHFVFDDNWLWQDLYIRPDGSAPIAAVKIPKQETAWVIGAIVIDPANGIQVPELPAIYTPSRRFYMVLEAPRRLIWGEYVGIRVALFNRGQYWAEVLVEMKKNSDFEFIQVDATGRRGSYSVRSVTNHSAHTMVYLPAGSTKMVYFPVLPRKLGLNRVSFCAYAFLGGECASVAIDVAMNGVLNTYHTSILLDLVSRSELLAQNLRIEPEQDFVEPEKRWRRHVPGSKSSRVSVVGDIVGPSFSSSLPAGDATSILGRPHGSAESVLFSMNWNVQMLHYLRLTKQLTANTLDSVLNYVNSQFSRLSFFVDPVTGGVANFPEVFFHETSSFLTAYALYTIAETASSEWDKVSKIDESVFKKFLNFLRANQVADSDEKFGGSITDGVKWDLKYFNAYAHDHPINSSYGPYLERVPLTALTVIAALHPNIPAAEATLAKDIAKSGLIYLSRHLTKLIDDSLCLSMAAYAFAFDEQGSDKFKARDLLLSAARNDNHLYWAAQRVLPAARETDSAGRTVIRARVERSNDAYAVQATSFALLALLKSNPTRSSMSSALLENVTKVVNFIAETKNSNNGWVSTQDTVFAVRALRELAQRDLNRDIYRLMVSVAPTSNASKAANFLLSGDDLSQARQLVLNNDDTWGEVQVRASGSGRALLQLNSRKAVENAFQVKNSPEQDNCPQQGCGLESQRFELTCTPSFGGRNGSLFYMTACARWTWTERSESSGMALLAFTFPTGYHSSNYGLRNVLLAQRVAVPNLRHLWNDGAAINAFFTNISSKQATCLTIRIPRWHPVANTTIEQTCQIYEYFETDNANYTMYSTMSLQANDICRVCGSYQCPYCVDYNGSTSLGSFVFWHIVVISAALKIIIERS